MVLYFSGTGNSRYAAEVIAKHTGDNLVSINELMRKGSTGPIGNEKPLVIVAPIYAFCIPLVVYDFLKAAEITGNPGVWFILTCGRSAVGAEKELRKLCSEKDLAYMGAIPIVMPGNYVVLYDTPDAKKAAATLERALPAILGAADTIRQGKAFRKQRGGLGSCINSSLIKPLFYAAMINAKGFLSTASCIGCGKCEKVCPLCNVTLRNSRPVWGSNCTHCMACISVCPAKAIEFGKKTQNRRRYWNALKAD